MANSKTTTYLLGVLFGAVATGRRRNDEEQEPMTWWMLMATWGREQPPDSPEGPRWVPIIGMVPVFEPVLREVVTWDPARKSISRDTRLALDIRDVRQGAPPVGRHLQDYVLDGHVKRKLTLPMWDEMWRNTRALWSDAESRLANAVDSPHGRVALIDHMAKTSPWRLLNGPLLSAAMTELGMPPESFPTDVALEAIQRERSRRGAGRPPSQAPYRDDLEVFRAAMDQGAPPKTAEAFIERLTGEPRAPRTRERMARAYHEQAVERGFVPQAVPLFELARPPEGPTVDDEERAMLELVDADAFVHFMRVVACGAEDRIMRLERVGVFRREVPLKA